MINNNKPFHSSNLYEENLNRSSKKSSGRNSNVSQSFKNKKNENSFGGTLTEPSPYDDSDKIYKYRGIPSSNPLEKPNKDANKVSEFTRPTENPAYFMKEKELHESKKKARETSRNTSLDENRTNKSSKLDEKNMNKTSSTQNLKPETMNKVIQENNRMSLEITSLKSKINDYENLQKEKNQFQTENHQLKLEINNIQSLKHKENEYNEILKDFETNFRNKIMEVEAEKEYYKGLNKEYLTERNNLRLEKEEKIYQLEYTINQLQEKLKEKEWKLADVVTNTNDSDGKIQKITEEKDRLTVDLSEKVLEIGIWKEKYYELMDLKEKLEKQAKYAINQQSYESMSYEISSLRIQTRELMEKMEILNKIIEGHAMERENLETELKIYKQKLSEAEKKIKENEKGKILLKEKEDLELLRDNMKKKTIEDEKKILTLIAEFEKLNTHCSQQDDVIMNQEITIKDLRSKITDKMRNSKGFNSKNYEVLSEKTKESERTIQALEDQVESLKTELTNSLSWKKKNEETISNLSQEKNHMEIEMNMLINDLSNKKKEMEKCFNMINDQNNTIKRLTELGDFRQSVCLPRSENPLSYSFGEDESMDKGRSFTEINNSKTMEPKYQSVSGNMDKNEKLISNRSYFTEEEKVKKSNQGGDFESFSKPFKI